MNFQSSLALILSIMTWMSLYDDQLNQYKPTNILFLHQNTKDLSFENEIDYCEEIGFLISYSCLNETNLVKSNECNLCWIKDEIHIFAPKNNNIFYDYLINGCTEYIENDEIKYIRFILIQNIHGYFFNLIMFLFSSFLIMIFLKIKSSKFSIAKIVFIIDLMCNLIFTCIYYFLNKNIY
jgi:hypothetical protein